MAANRIGQLYQYTGKGSLPLWDLYYNELGRIEANIPFLIIDKIEDASWSTIYIQKYWIKVLVEEKVGWIKSTFLNIMWIDPEDHL